MNLRSADEILDATEHLPSGATLVVPHVAWEDYERLLEDLAERPHLRVSYDRGRLEIVSPLSEHEEYARFVDQLVVVFSDVFALSAESRGSTTWKKRALEKGVEPDCCYYVKSAEIIIGKREIDLDSDSRSTVRVTGECAKKLRRLRDYSSAISARKELFNPFSPDFSR